MKSWLRVISLIIPYFFVVGIFQLIGSLIAGVDYQNNDFKETSTQQLIISVFNLMGTFLVLWIFMTFIDTERFINLGFHTQKRLKEFIVGLLVGLLIMSLGFILLIILDEISLVRIQFSFKELLISILLFTSIAVAEETLFRGYILKNLMDSFNKYAALAISSILFSLMHSFNPNADLISLIDLSLAGVLLGLSYIFTKNLWFPIALHLSWNLFQSLFGFNVSGIDTYSIIEFQLTSENVLNGGAFGFEGSYLSIIAQLITIIGIGLYYNRKGNY